MLSRFRRRDYEALAFGEVTDLVDYCRDWATRREKDESGSARVWQVASQLRAAFLIRHGVVDLRRVMNDPAVLGADSGARAVGRITVSRDSVGAVASATADASRQSNAPRSSPAAAGYPTPRPPR